MNRKKVQVNVKPVQMEFISNKQWAEIESHIDPDITHLKKYIKGVEK
jgi:hypothetical protein